LLAARRDAVEQRQQDRRDHEGQVDEDEPHQLVIGDCLDIDDSTFTLIEPVSSFISQESRSPAAAAPIL
jgi:hypothetical protein